MRTELVIVGLFAVATLVALAARRLKVPYTVALVLAGLGLGSAHVFEAPHLTKELLYTIFLPGLLFEAAFHIEFRKFLQNKLAVFSLSLPGVIASVLLTTVLLVPTVEGLALEERFTWREGLVFASLIAATDPIAVVALFKSLGAPKRLAVLVEGESLLNDGTSVVVFTLVLAFVTGAPTTAAHAVVDFARVVGLGVLIGLTIGYAASFVIHKVDDPMIEITVTTIAAYGSFAVAESVHLSGVIATVTAGMLCGNHAAPTGMSASTRVAVASFWEYLAFALNSLVFLLIGFEVRLEELLHAWRPVLVAFAAVTIARAVVIGGVGIGLSRTREKIPLPWLGVLTWGGLRGALSMVLVLGLPTDFGHRSILVTTTFGVVILSILVQGTTMGSLLRKLRLVSASETKLEHEKLRGRLKSGRSALAELQRMSAQRGFAEQAVAPLRDEYERRVRETEQSLEALHSRFEGFAEEERLVARRQALIVEKDTILSAYRSGEIGEQSYEELLADVDARLFELESSGDPTA